MTKDQVAVVTGAIHKTILDRMADRLINERGITTEAPALWTDEDYAVAKEIIETMPHPDRTRPGDEFGGSVATDPGEPASIAGDDAEDARKMAEWDAANP